MDDELYQMIKNDEKDQTNFTKKYQNLKDSIEKVVYDYGLV